MFLDLPLLVDLVNVQQRRQALMDINLQRQNWKRWEFTHGVGGEVLIKTVDPKKLEPRTHGPHTVGRVHANRTIDVHRNPCVTERLSIRHVIPHRRN